MSHVTHTCQRVDLTSPVETAIVHRIDSLCKIKKQKISFAKKTHNVYVHTYIEQNRYNPCKQMKKNHAPKKNSIYTYTYIEQDYGIVHCIDSPCKGKKNHVPKKKYMYIYNTEPPRPRYR